MNIVEGNTVNGKPLVYLEDISNYTVADAGQVVLIRCKNIRVENLNLSATSIGVLLWKTNNTIIVGNTITKNYDTGIAIIYSSNNSIIGNNITNNGWGIESFFSSNNSIYHNNFINNGIQVFSIESFDIWDNGYPSGGNYWSDYVGIDAGDDGIGNTPYIINANNQDRYPLISPFKFFEAGVWDGTAYNVDVLSNSTVSDFKFDVDNKSISLKVTGDNGTVGFCRVAIPKSLLWADNGWTIFVDNQPITDYTKFEDENYTYLYFTYTHSTKTVTIKGTHVIPEFHSTIILTIFMLTTTVLVALTRNKRLRNLFSTII
jgi:parallel beta-helix repeat protein